MSRAIHEAIATAAQQYLDEPTSTPDVQDTFHEALARLRNVTADNGRDQAYDELQIVSIRREAPCAAISRLICNEAAGLALSSAKEMSKNQPPFYAAYASGQQGDYNTFFHGTAAFFDEASRTVSTALKDEAHPHHQVYKVLCEEQARFNEASKNVTGREKRTAMVIGPPTTADKLLQDAFSDNYKVQVASFLIAHGIAEHIISRTLPAAGALQGSMADGRPQWLALATFNRRAFGHIFYGPRYHAAMIAEMDQTKNFPSWVNFWGEGFNAYFQPRPQQASDPFYGCTAESPLLYDRATAVVPQAWESARRCAGQLALSSDAIGNEIVMTFLASIDSQADNQGIVSPAELTLDTGNFVAGRTLYADEACRKTFAVAQRACLEAREQQQFAIAVDHPPSP